MWVPPLGREDPLGKEMATQSNILAWEIPWREELGVLQSTGSQRVGHYWSDLARSTVFYYSSETHHGYRNGSLWKFPIKTLASSLVSEIIGSLQFVFPDWLFYFQKLSLKMFSSALQNLTLMYKQPWAMLFGNLDSDWRKVEWHLFLAFASAVLPPCVWYCWGYVSETVGRRITPWILRGWYLLTKIEGRRWRTGTLKSWISELWTVVTCGCCSVAQSCLTLRAHGRQHTRSPCPSPSPRVRPSSCPSHWCYHPAISSSDALLSFCPPSFPASASYVGRINVLFSEHF